MSKRFRIYNVTVNGVYASVIASRYPMLNTPTDYIPEGEVAGVYPIEAEADYVRQFDKAVQLSEAGTDTGLPHDCYLKGICVSFDVDYPAYWELQRSRYHFIDIVSSSSKMHRLANTNILLNCNEWTDLEVMTRVAQLQKEYVENKTQEGFNRLVSSLPMGYMLSERLTTNYLQLKTIYKQRRNHRLPEWQYVCDWIETLPFMQQFLKIKQHETEA